MKEEFLLLSEADLPEMAKLFREAFAGEPWKDDWSDEEQLALYMKEISGAYNCLNFGLKIDGRLVAMSVGSIRHWWEGTNYNIEELCVLPEMQGQGLGSRFLAMIEENVRRKGMAGIFLQTDSDKPAFQFYHKMGFGDLGAHVSLYKNLSDRIVKGTPEDRDDILSLYRAQVGQEFCPWTEEYPSVETIDYDLSKENLFVMKEGGRIIAAISIDDDDEVDRLSVWDKKLAPGGALARLAVLPEKQGLGVAKSMLQYAMEVLRERNSQSVHFLVNIKNQKAIRAYASLGFRIVGSCHMFGQDMDCYEKEL